MERVTSEILFDAASSVYYVRGQSWAVAEHYTLHHVLGSGSFSCVCLATSKITSEKVQLPEGPVARRIITQVALKRIPDVLQSTENAKRVLRELCILRRLSHPYCISLKHAFVMPSDTGAWKLRNGELCPCSIDLYLAMEYGGGGDLHDLRGQLSEHDVRRLMWQILTAVEYLHSQDVWHRDLKSANVLLTVESGQRVCKVADFGSARSAVSQPLHRESGLVGRRTVRTASQMSIDADNDRDWSREKQSLTQRVCTPCYRAPEVVMSRGGYTSALDMWSVGCIFAELLQRISYVGSAATPHLKVSPVFCVTGFPVTPLSGEHYEAGPGNATTRAELEALFQVIGTPAWACIEAVDSAPWKSYLRNLPLKAGTLHRRFGYAGEVAVDLLSRLLTFDPSRRCSAREAMLHEYFKPFWTSTKEMASLSDEGSFASASSGQEGEYDAEEASAMTVRYHEIDIPAKALQALEEEMVEICANKRGCDQLQVLLEKECQLLAESQSRKLGTEMSGRYGSVTNSLARKCMREGPSEWTKLLKEGLVVDPNCDKTMKPESFGPGRLPLVADSAKACLDAEKHLAVGRQQEWTVTSGCGRINISHWGVSLVPPGTDEATMDPEVKRIIRSQQLR